MLTLWSSYSVVVIEGYSSFITSGNDAVVQHLKCEPIEGDSSEFTLTDTSSRNATRVIPQIPLMLWTHGYLDFTTVTWKVGSTLRGTRASIRSKGCGDGLTWRVPVR